MTSQGGMCRGEAGDYRRHWIVTSPAPTDQGGFVPSPQTPAHTAPTAPRHSRLATQQTRVPTVVSSENTKIYCYQFAKLYILGATSVVLSRPKCTKNVGGRGFAPDPSGELTTLPQTAQSSHPTRRLRSLDTRASLQSRLDPPLCCIK